MVDKTCEQCGKRFEVSRSRAATAKYCSKACYGRAQQKPAVFVCPQCGRQFVETACLAARRKFCSKECYTAAQRVLAERHFHEHIAPPDENGCMLWTGGVGRGGYGATSVSRSKSTGVSAHRLAYDLAYGPIPEGMCVLHRCDTKLCCNPSHLFAGTLADNNRDMVEKGRQAKGVQHGMHKLTEAEVRRIREATQAGFTAGVLAALHGVTKGNIWHIVHGETWKHLT